MSGAVAFVIGWVLLGAAVAVGSWTYALALMAIVDWLCDNGKKE